MISTMFIPIGDGNKKTGPTHIILQHIGPTLKSFEQYYTMPVRYEQMMNRYMDLRNAGCQSARFCTEAMFDESAAWCERTAKENEI